jgi:hypothetical protein
MSHVSPRDVLARMMSNAVALRRWLTAQPEATLDAEHMRHYQELLDEIAMRETRHTNQLNELLVQAHLDRRVNPFERRQHLGERRHPVTG